MRTNEMGTKLGNLRGRRIRFLHTDNPYNKMKYGATGTIIGVQHDVMDEDDAITLLVKLDDGSNVTLISPRDMFEFVD